MNRSLILFSYDFPPSDGGIARLCHEIAVGAGSYYERVVVLTRERTGYSVLYNQSAGIELVEVRPQRGACEYDCFRYLRAIRNKEQYDIICGLWHPEAAIALAAGFKEVYTLAHGAELLPGASLFRKSFWLPIYGKYILKSVKSVIANSSYTEKLVKNICSDVRSIAIPLAVNEEFFKPASKEKTDRILSICTVSRIQPFKAHDFILKTIAKLPQEYKDRLHYNIAGTGPYLSQLKRLAAGLDLKDRVSFHGFIPDLQLPAFYNANELFILCTRESGDSTQVEGFGLVFLEAQACGLPVIGSRTGGIPDAVEEGNGGWLIEQDNEKELSDLLVRLTDNPQLLREMGRKARTRVEKEATWKMYCKKLFSYIRI